MNIMWKLQDIVPTKREQHALPPVGRGLANQEIADKLNEFTLTSTSTALISGTVYKDEDGDEIYDANVDIPIPGAIVSALIGHEIVAIDCTDEKGEYVLSLPAGALYTLKVALPSRVACYNPELKGGVAGAPSKRKVYALYALLITKTSVLNIGCSTTGLEILLGSCGIKVLYSIHKTLF